MAAVFNAAAKSVDGVVKSAKTLQGIKPSRAFDDMAKSAKALNNIKPLSGWGASFQREIDKMNLSARELARVQREFARFQTIAPRFKVSAFTSAFDTWKTKTLTGLREVRAEQERLEKHGHRIRGVGRTAAMALGIGSGAYVAGRGVRATVTAGAENVREGARDYLAGLSDAESDRLKSSAQGLSLKNQSVSANAMHNQLREAANSMRSIDKAIELGSTISDALTVLQTMKGKDRAPEELRRFLAGLDVLGKNQDAGQVRELLGGYIRAAQTEGADLDLGGMLLVARQARAAGSSLSNRFLTHGVPALGRDMGDPQVGTALSSGLSQVIGGRATKQSKAEQERMGLRRKGEFVGASQFQSDPDLWAWQTLIPALQKRGVDLKDDTAVAGTISKLFSNRTVADLITKFVSQREQYEAKYRQYDKNPGLEAAAELPKRDPYVAASGLAAQLQNFAAVLTEPAMEKAPAILNALSSAIGGLTQQLSKDEALKKDASTAGLLGALATTAGGSAWLSSIMPAGTAMGALGGAAAGGLSALSGIGFVLAWHAAGAEKRKELIEEYKKQQTEKAKNAPDLAGARALGQLNDLENYQDVLDKSALGGAFRQAQLRKIEAERARMQPELERLGYGPSSILDRGYDKPLSIERIHQVLGIDRQPTETRVTGEVKGETTVTVKVEAGSELLRVVGDAKTAKASLTGRIGSNGPGSLGTSSPDAAAATVGGP